VEIQIFPIKFSDLGTYHSRGPLHFDRNKPEHYFVTTLAQELVHLRTYVMGAAASTQNMSREQYINTQMADEIEAQAIAYISFTVSGDRSSKQAAGFRGFLKFLNKNHI
jgi:hypothetical protein